MLYFLFIFCSRIIKIILSYLLYLTQQFFILTFNKIMRQRQQNNNQQNKNLNKSKQIVNHLSKHTNFLKNKLKKQLQSKFNKKLRPDEINITTRISHFKNHSTSSLMLNNPLTKSSFSLSDSITHKANYKKTLPKQSIMKSVYNSNKIITLACRERYKSLDQSIFQTRAQVQYRDKDSRFGIGKSAQISPRKIENKIEKQIESCNLQSRHNKFKLLFKQKKSTYKSASQRKISRIDTKINALKHKKSFLQSLLPIQKPKPVYIKPVPKKYNINDEQMKDRILKMIRLLIKTIELLYNMYQHNNIVGGHLKNVQGYNNKIRQILMMDDVRAKRIAKTQELSKYFSVFKNRAQRSQFYMQEDMAIYNLLNNFNMKMQKKYSQSIASYTYYDLQKRIQQKQGLNKAQQRFEQKIGKHEQINKINAFIQKRMRYEQINREQNMQNLQKRGVILNIIERSRQLILRQKQQSFKQSLKIKINKK